MSFLESSSAEGVLWFAMEYVEGVSAASHVRSSGLLPEPEVVALGCQLLDPLAHAHLQGVVHRDVKPGKLGKVICRALARDLRRRYADVLAMRCGGAVA